IIENLRGHTSGLAIPHFVIDAPGGGGKIPLLPNYVLHQDEDKIVLRNFQHKVYSYKNYKDKNNLGKKNLRTAVKIGSNGSNGKSGTNGNTRNGKAKKELAVKKIKLPVLEEVNN